MTFFRFGLAVLLLLLASFMTTNAFAQADKTGIDLRVGLSVPFYSGSPMEFREGSYSQRGINMTGVGLDIQALYRWKNVGVGIEQFLGGAIASWDSSNDDLRNLGEAIPEEVGFFKYGEGTFYGATYFIVKAYFPANPSHLITISTGIGAAYGAGEPEKHIFGNTSDSALSVKLELGYAYFIMDTYGIGVNLEYQAHMIFGEHSCYASKSDPAYTWTIAPQVFFNMVF